MKITETNIKGLLLIDHPTFKDKRGQFKEVFRKDLIEKFINYEINFCQENIVNSSKNVLRGLHFQKKPFDQSKLITVISGKIMDVAVDIRKESKTYGQYFSCILSDYENKSIFIPKGFAHGYLSLCDNTIINYKVDNYYQPKSEGGILYNDDFLNIDWGFKNRDFNISSKDIQFKKFQW